MVCNGVGFSEEGTSGQSIVVGRKIIDFCEVGKEVEKKYFSIFGLDLDELKYPDEKLSHV
jgi:hypothetical protein